MKLQPGDLAELPPGGVIGIDPGFSGGIAYVWDIGKAAAWDMPETEQEIWDLVHALSEIAKLGVVEAVQAMPAHLKGQRQGSSSVFKFGMTYGWARMALVAARVSHHRVAPGRWQRTVQCLTGGNKNISKAKAQELFPRTTNRITHATADAILIAEFGRRTFLMGQPELKREKSKRIAVPTPIKKHKRVALTG